MVLQILVVNLLWVRVLVTNGNLTYTLKQRATNRGSFLYAKIMKNLTALIAIYIAKQMH